MDKPYHRYELKRTRSATSKIDYDGALNDEQRRAVLAGEGPVLVVAGAGTGKTRTLVYRVARLLETGVAPHRIALLTFTRRAAQEMTGRVARLTKSEMKGLVSGTFHAFATRMLHQHPPEGYGSPFTILDRGDAEDTIQLLRGERGIRRGERRFPKKQTLADIYSKAVNRSLSIREIIAEEYEQFVPHTEPIEEIADAYGAFKKKHALMDYDDLLVFLAAALEGDGPTAQEMRARFRHVLVDEYQDTNRVQADIADRLVADERNIMVVGDDAQSIYAFRGADYRNILAFPDRFPDAEIIKLERNYRSTQEVLDVANAVIAGGSIGFEKQLRTDRRGDRPVMAMADSDADQAQFVVQRVIELREEGVPLNDMAVLFRSSFHSYELELELTRRDVPFVKYGGFRFLEAAHVKDLLAHLRVVVNPLDAISWTRLLCLVPGVGPRRAAAILEEGAQRNTPFSLTAAAGSARKTTRDALRGLETLFAELMEEKRAPADLVARTIAYYEPIATDRFDDHPRRLRDLEHLQVIAEGYGGLAAMLADMSLEPPDRAVDNGLASPLSEGERLVLSTVHSAKGMEWKTVFLLSALDGYFPTAWSVRDPEELEEERRLMYVALTRVKTSLYICYPVQAYHAATGRVLHRPSRFLDDVREGDVERWAIT